MTPLTTAQLRQAYIDFFTAQGCVHHPSDSLIPQDPTTLFTVAGMAQFKEDFLGRGSKPFSRAVTVQKCIRTNDIMEVGRTPRHHTFFEMLGNFSFNDYFKRETIAWAWEFLTEVLAMPAERLWVSVHHDDDEAAEIWKRDIGLPPERLVRMGDDDNFWPAGAPADGPLGPGGCCSEIFWDYQTNDDPADTPAAEEDSGRFVEIWNLVFPQFNVAEPKVDGRYTLEDLGRTNIDTGAGLERLACVLQGRRNNFDIDLLQIIVQQVSAVSGQAYQIDDGSEITSQQAANNTLLRRVADHVRAVTFCIADGALPGNAGRGSIVRRLIRRAVLDIDKLGVHEVRLHEIVPSVVTAMGEAYPEIARRQDLAVDTLQAEEQLFRRTLKRGMDLFHKLLGQVQADGGNELSGDDVFDLFTTYGFPVEITEELAAAEGVDIDHDRLQQCLKDFAEVSKGGREIEVFTSSALQEAKPRLGATTFLGYDHLTADATITLLECEGAEVERAEVGSKVRFALNQTPFYAESGGQVADSGSLTAAVGEAFSIAVEDVQKDEGLFIHRGVVTAGVARATAVRCEVDADRRQRIIAHHSATHLAHSALCRVLGDHVEQQGSKVEPAALRFDYNHAQAPNADELQAVEVWVNEQITASHAVTTDVLAVDEARARGAKALFGEKYGSEVRMVSMGGREVSIELCGGCHVANTAEITGFRVVRDEASAAGIRRLTAVAGPMVAELVAREQSLASTIATLLGGNDEPGEAAVRAALQDLARRLKVSQDEVPERLTTIAAEADQLGLSPLSERLCGGLVNRFDQLQDAIKQGRKAQAQAQAAAALAELDDLAAAARDLHGLQVVAKLLPGVPAKALQQAAQTIKDRGELDVALLASDAGGKAMLVVVASPAAIARGLKAGAIISQLAPMVAGRGGGRPDMAQGGGPGVADLPQAIGALDMVIDQACSSSTA